MADFLPQKAGERHTVVHLHDCLEALTLLGNEYNEIYGDEPRRPLGYLAHFKKLRCIGTDGLILFGTDSVKLQLVDSLTAAFETLVIREFDDDIYAQLRGIFSHGKRKFTALETVAIGIRMARAGRLEDNGPNGKHMREVVVKKCIKRVESHPEIPDWRRNLAELMKELEQIQSRKPSEVEWEEWRSRQRVEKELIVEFNEVGIDLCFNLIRDDEWTFVPPFMCY